ncbi:MAG TPA: hypothetical protein VE954_05885 [Oligoflexus sp.]|uniref:hypothetical protein n=1 Tax=Oligoflexus sp. TaxID=1971216 RepID=UPI002D2EB23B|nr:hypothetical protein [Oligoflexus sp.]HYX32623.1 hypothetical protein [Oligoflexus sp.]
MQKFKMLAGASLLILWTNAARSQTSGEIFRVPFDGCDTSFGSGENIWYFCPNKVHALKTDSVSSTENALIQSLPVHGKLRVAFVCRSTEPVMTTISINKQNFQLNPDSTLNQHDFEVFLEHSQTGTEKWLISSNLRKPDYVSLKKGCYLEVSKNLSLVHIPTIKVYGEFLSGSVSDLTEILEALNSTVTSDLSEVRVSLDGGIKNIKAVLEKTTDPATKLLLNQSLNKLLSIQKTISQSCEQTDASLCTTALSSARKKVQDTLTDQETDLTSLSTFLQDEIDRLETKEQDVVKELQEIKDGLQ